MCLNRVDKKTKNFTYGWKIFWQGNITGKLKGQFNTKHGYMKKGYPTGRWIKDAKTGNLRSGNSLTGYELYEKGFHFYKTKAAAKRLFYGYRTNDVIRKIKVRNVVASGVQDSEIVGVAKEMFILK